MSAVAPGVNLTEGDRAALESALLTHGDEWWDDNDRGIYADELIGFDSGAGGMDAATLAHIIWTMGARKQHEGCRYGAEYGNDGDYENQCVECRDYLEQMAARVIAAVSAEGPLS